MRARSGSANERLSCIMLSNAALPPIKMEEGAIVCVGPALGAIDVSEPADSRGPESMAAEPGTNDMLVIA